MPKFNERLDIKLIKAVKGHPVLYDISDSKYTDFNAREVIWQKIGDELQCPAHVCKARWVNIRDINRRSIRKNMNFSDIKHNRTYKYASEMLFLLPYYKDIEPQCLEITDDLPDYDSASVKSESPEPPPKRVKKQRMIAPEEPEEHSFTETYVNSHDLDLPTQVDAFLTTIGKTLKTFSPYFLNLAKTQIFAVVQEHELQQIVKKGDTDVDVLES